jgi:hypothetical protein
MLLPATAVAGPVFTIETSACVVTLVVTVLALLAGFGSDVVDDTVAVLLMFVPLGVPAFIATTIEYVSLPPDGRSAPLAGPVRCVSETSVVFGGAVSAKVAATAVSGPLLATMIEYVTLVPATADAGPILVTERSEEAVTVVFTTLWLFAATGSGVVDDTLAVFVIVVPTEPAFTVTTSV